MTNRDEPQPVDLLPVLLHLVLVVLCSLPFVGLLLAPTDEGVNIRLAALSFPVLPLGLPWSVPYLYDPYAFDDLSDTVRAVVVLSPAYLNVLLHAGWRWYRKRA